MADYIPLLTLVVTVVGATDALARINPPPRSTPVFGELVMPLTAAGKLTVFGRPPVTTPPGDPSLFADVRTSRYVAPPSPGLRAFQLIPRTAFPRPNLPGFVSQTSRAPTSEQVAVA